MATTFISYRREDSAGYAGRLCESLERRLGHDAVFRDVDTIQPGQDFVDAITSRLRECRVFIAVIGREWLDARDAAGHRRLDQPHDYVRLEIAAALQRPDMLVVPVLVEGADMPPPESLPSDIQPLARRHAVTLRDETWDEDVERLAAVARKARPGRTPRAAARWPVWAALALIAIAAAAVYFARTQRNDRASDPPAAVRTSAHGIPIPRLAEIAHGSIIYTLVSGNVLPNGNRNTVRLRIRCSNEGSVPANFWNNSFRLLAGDNVVTPSNDLNDVVAGHSIQHGIVTFDVPATIEKAIFEVQQNDEKGDIPLDLSRTGDPPTEESADAGDALSRAILRSIIDDQRPLISGNDLSMALLRVTSRRFANKVKLFIATRLANGGRVSAYSGTVTLRVQADGDLKAPAQVPSEALDAGTSKPLDYVFEVSPSTSRAVLRASIGNSIAEVVLEVR